MCGPNEENKINRGGGQDRESIYFTYHLHVLTITVRKIISSYIKQIVAFHDQGKRYVMQDASNAKVTIYFNCCSNE